MKRNVLDEPALLENLVVEEAHRANRLIECAPRHVTVDEMRLVREDVLGTKGIRRLHKEFHHPPHTIQIDLCGFLAVPADCEFIAHPIR